MIAYIFTAAELRFLCGALEVKGLPAEEFSGEGLSEDEREEVLKSLSRKGFFKLGGEGAVINSGIAFLIKMLGSAEKLYLNVSGEFFAGYICGEVSLLLRADEGSGKYFLYPFEKENELISRLHDNNIFEWKEIRGKDEIYG